VLHVDDVEFAIGQQIAEDGRDALRHVPAVPRTGAGTAALDAHGLGGGRPRPKDLWELAIGKTHALGARV
jgi:hypothetical protein